MEKFTPYEKLSKKRKRELDVSRRGSWKGLNPVTRCPENPKAYNRRKAQNWKREYAHSVPFDFFLQESPIFQRSSASITVYPASISSFANTPDPGISLPEKLPSYT